MANLSKLAPRLDPKKCTCRAIIETPRGCRNKFDYDPDSGLFMLAGLLPEGMMFPFDFGFIPSPRRRNLWVTDTLQWRPEARLALPADPRWDRRLQLLLFVASCLSNQFALSGKRYAVKRHSTSNRITT